ncbi:MAG: hypothetical protein MUC49_02435 [Raineya sp.]|jgi:hypothetical protein|nr:hypothetical protein [Raineya sp.]
MMNIIAYLKPHKKHDISIGKLHDMFAAYFRNVFSLKEISNETDVFDENIEYLHITFEDSWWVEFFIHRKEYEKEAGVFVDVEKICKNLEFVEDKNIILNSSCVIRMLFSTDAERIHTNDTIYITEFIQEKFDCIIIGPDFRIW